MTERYAGTADLLVGDVAISATDGAKFINAAADEIDAAIGFVYAIPLNPVPSAHVLLLLKRCNALIASGRLLLARAAGGEDGSLHAYGASLLDEGQGILSTIANGSVQLIGLDKVGPQASDDAGNAPAIFQGDASSGTDAFYEWLNNPYSSEQFTPGNPYWGPGA